MVQKAFQNITLSRLGMSNMHPPVEGDKAGEAMEKHPRDSYYLATKYTMFANPDYKAVFEEQLQLNYFDWRYGTAKEEYKILEERHIPVMVMEPVWGGRH